MRPEEMTVTVWPRRFEPPPVNPPLANPASPTVIQGFVQVMASLSQQMAALSKKVDALATRTPQVVAPAQPEPKSPPETAAQADEALELKPAPRRRLDRSKLLDIFD